MAVGGRNKDARIARERARAYQARAQLHAAQLHRRRRDNLITGVGGGIGLVVILAGQFAFFTAGPGKHPTSASPSPSASVVSPSPTSSR